MPLQPYQLKFLGSGRAGGAGLMATIRKANGEQARKALVADFASSVRTAMRCVDRNISTTWSRGHVQSITQPGKAVIRISRKAHLDGRTESEISKLLDHVGAKWFKVDSLQTWVIEIEAEAA